MEHERTYFGIYFPLKEGERANAKVVAAVWGTELDEFNLFFQIDQGKTASAARNLINSGPQTDATTFAFASVSILLL